MTDDPTRMPDLSVPDPMTAATATSAPPASPAQLTEASPAPSTEAPPAPSTAAPPALDPGDAALFGVIDRLAAILDHSDLVELEIQVGDTGLTLRKPTALAQPVAVAGAGSSP